MPRFWRVRYNSSKAWIPLVSMSVTGDISMIKCSILGWEFSFRYFSSSPSHLKILLKVVLYLFLAIQETKAEKNNQICLSIKSSLPLLGVVRVRKINSRIDPDDYNSGDLRCFRVLNNVSVHSCIRKLSENGGPRPCHLQQNFRKRDRHLSFDSKYFRYSSGFEFRVSDGVLTAINNPISTEMKTTPKKAPMHATKSNLSILNIKIIASMSIRPSTADMIIEARIAFGVYLNSGVMTKSVSKTTHDMTMLETAVLHPAM